jgi:FeS assembly SUF system protein
MTIFDWLKKAEEFGDKEMQQANEPRTDSERLRQDVIQALRQIYDPEIPVNIYDLGLVYSLDVDDNGAVRIQMTLTSPACPVAQSFPDQVEAAVNDVPGVNETQVELVWDPPWSRELMSEAAMLELGLL